MAIMKGETFSLNGQAVTSAALKRAGMVMSLNANETNLTYLEYPSTVTLTGPAGEYSVCFIPDKIFFNTSLKIEVTDMSSNNTTLSYEVAYATN
jgi:hypothetical protein